MKEHQVNDFFAKNDKILLNGRSAKSRAHQIALVLEIVIIGDDLAVRDDPVAPVMDRATSPSCPS